MKRWTSILQRGKQVKMTNDTVVLLSLAVLWALACFLDWRLIMLPPAIAAMFFAVGMVMFYPLLALGIMGVVALGGFGSVLYAENNRVISEPVNRGKPSQIAQWEGSPEKSVS